MPEGALDRYFASLARAESGEPGHITRALHFGDSTIASDGITKTVRKRLQGHYGDGGPGFLAVQVDRRWAVRPGVLRDAEGSWKTLTITFGGAEMAYYGLGGTNDCTGCLDQRARRPEGRGRAYPPVFFQVSRGGTLSLATDNGATKSFQTAALPPRRTERRPDGATGDDGPAPPGAAMETADRASPGDARGCGWSHTDGQEPHLASGGLTKPDRSSGKSAETSRPPGAQVRRGNTERYRRRQEGPAGFPGPPVWWSRLVLGGTLPGTGPLQAEPRAW